MGFRTVVMLSNDYAHEWENDPELGRKIALAMNYAGRGNERALLDSYGEVVQCTHGDTQTLAVLDGYTMFEVVASKFWNSGETADDVALKLLKEAAERMGYRLAKKPAKKLK